MKNFPNQTTLLALVILFLFSTSLTAQEFQRVYGDALDNYFSKVIQDGSGNFYVLGQNEAVNGAPLRATVTRLDANGQHQWTPQRAPDVRCYTEVESPDIYVMVGFLGDKKLSQIEFMR